MILFTLWHNISRSRQLTFRSVDAVKYLTWLYASSFKGSLSCRWTLCLAFPQFSEPVRVYVRANRGSDRHVLGEIFDMGSYAVDLDSPQRILDLGANGGLASVYFSIKWPQARIVAVEPMPDNAAVARRNFELNQISGMVIEAAISSYDGELKLHAHEQSAMNTVEERDVDGSGIRVRSLSVDSLLAELGWSTVDFVKMDIEGYESVVLRNNNSWLRRVAALCLEIHGEFKERDLQLIATQEGFQLSRLPAGTYLLKR